MQLNVCPYEPKPFGRCFATKLQFLYLYDHIVWSCGTIFKLFFASLLEGVKGTSYYVMTCGWGLISFKTVQDTSRVSIVKLNISHGDNHFCKYWSWGRLWSLWFWHYHVSISLQYMYVIHTILYLKTTSNCKACSFLYLYLSLILLYFLFTNLFNPYLENSCSVYNSNYSLKPHPQDFMSQSGICRIIIEVLNLHWSF